ncbi:choice-of-anchor Q domain-containing protein, partial [Bacteroidota bacterium]
IRKPREKYLLEENKRADITEYLEKETKSNYKGKANVQDSLALLALYNTTNGPNWSSNNWLTCPVAEWTGITLDNDGRVKSINLYQKELNGIIPPEIGSLTKLESLDLYWNKLSGSIPKEIGNLVNLEFLYLNYNHLTGSIPSELGNLTSLRYLHLNLNRFSGTIPPELGSLTNLITLYLKDNYLSGSIPPELGNLSSLEILSLYDNELSGNIPSELGNLSKLESLHLEENNLTGNIPSELGNLTSLEYLDFYSNRLSGILPSELGNLSQLRSLDLGINMLSDDVPVEIGNLDSLRSFFLENNQFEGLPDLSGLVKLNYLWVWNNKLTFEDLEPNVNINAGIDFDYYPQEKIGTVQHYSPNVGDNLSFSAILGGTVNDYDWYRNNQFMSSFTTNTYTISDYSGNYPDEGIYYCKIDNAKAPDITIETRKIYVGVDVETYAISVTADPSEGGIVSGGGNYDEGETIKLVATPNTGYKFKEWTEVTSITTTFDTLYHTVERDRDFVANFEKKTFYVSSHVSASGGGTKTGEGIYEYGETAQVTAIPSEGCIFENWTYNGSIVSTSPILNVTVYQDMILTANFKKSTSTVQAYFVKPSANGGNDANDGLTWATAKANPQTAINAAETAGGGEVWVAAGEYNPTLTQYGNSHVDSTRYYTFTMKNNVKVYGGFAGTDDESVESRIKSDTDGNGTIEAWEFANPTILSGEIQSDADSSNNSYHVVKFPERNDSTAVLNGFTIRDGYSDLKEIGPSSTYNRVYASGIYAFEKAIIEDCIIQKCYLNVPSDASGNGVGVYSNQSSLNHCLVEKCLSLRSTYGTVHNLKSIITNSVIRNNVVNYRGGGLYQETSVAINCLIYNCTALNNSVSGQGSGVFNSSNSKLINCVVANCSSSGSDLIGIALSSSKSSTSNCIVWNNVSNDNIFSAQIGSNSNITYSAVQALDVVGEGNIDLAGNNVDMTGPHFKSPTSFRGAATSAAQELEIKQSNWSLLNGSPCINTGNNDSIPAIITTDLEGIDRISQENIDMGPYESQFLCVAPNNLNAINITKTSATLTWNPGYTETQWELEWGQSGFTQGNGTVVTANDSTYNLTGLDESTKYEFYVRSGCGGSESPWIGPYLFITGIYYVKPDGNDSNDGLSWENALANPQTAINIAVENGAEEVWIAAGIYKPTLDKDGDVNNDPRKHTFLMRNGVKVYGGFKGIASETIENREKNDRDNNGTIEPWEYTNETILSGEIQNDSDSSNNSRNVVLFSKISNGTSLINGITIKDGHIDDFEYSGGRSYSSGIYTYQNGKIEDCRITNCSGIEKTALGGSTYQYGGGVSLNNNSLLLNSLVDNCNGGGIASHNSKVFNSKVTNCIAFSGGGIYSSNSLVKHSTVENCFSKNMGGGIYSNNATTDSCQIYSCSAKGYGGGIYMKDNSVVSNCTIKKCSVIGTDNLPYGGSGGGIYSKYSLVEDSDIDSCYVYQTVYTSYGFYNPSGGGVELYHSVLNDCSISNSFCSSTVDYPSGGGLKSGWSEVDNCFVENCYSTSTNDQAMGGGIYVIESNLKNCIMRNCYSTSPSLARGGGMISFSSTISNCLIYNCTTKSPTRSNGGGMYNRGSDVNNCTVTNCFAESAGTAEGGGIYNWDNSVFTNSIVWNNGITGSSNYKRQIYNDNSSMYYCAIQGTSSSSTGHINLSENNTGTEVDENYPYFISVPDSIGIVNTPAGYANIANPNFNIQANSACINAGSNNYVPLDLDKDINGNNRIINGTVDMGAYEYSSEFTITINTNTGGTVNPSVISANNGDDATITITPDPGYEINAATYSTIDILNDLVQTGNSYTYEIVNITSNGVINITFTPIDYTVTANAGSNGTVTPTSASMTVEDSQDFTITSETGYTISTATNNGISIINDLVESGEDFIYTLTNVTENVNLEFTFKVDEYNIIVSSNQGGTVSPTNVSVVHGDNQTFTITPDSGYEISTALYNSVDVIDDLVFSNGSYTYTLNNVQEDGELTVAFSAIMFNVIATANEGGTVDPMNAMVAYSDSIVFYISPDEGKTVIAATYNGVDVLNELEEARGDFLFTVMNITEDGEFSVTFGGYDYSVTATAGLGGNVTPTFAQVSSGSNVTLTINCAASYQIETATYNGANVLSNIVNTGENCYTYTTTNITEDGAFNITFIPKTFSVIATSNSGGTVTPASSTVSFGSGQVFTIIPMDYGYGVISASYNNEDVYNELEKSGDHFTYRKTNIQEDGELIVTFGLIEYSLVANCNTGGSVTPDTTTAYHGTSQTFIIIPDENFHITEATYNDVNVFDKLVESNESYTYTVNNINEDGYLLVTFSNSTGIIANPNISFNIFPNPTSGSVSIQLQENYSEFKLRIVDINGKVVLINDHFNNQESLNLGELPPGIYHIIVEYDKQILTKRLIKK